MWLGVWRHSSNKPTANNQRININKHIIQPKKKEGKKKPDWKLIKER